MKPTPRVITLLAVIVGMGATAAAAWWRNDGVQTQAALQPVVQAAPRSAMPQPFAAVAAAPDASLQPVAASAPRLPADPSRLQREIQRAISGDPQVKAGEAAKHLMHCQTLELVATRQRERLEATQHLVPAAAYRESVDAMEKDLSACQAVDAASRAQLMPLLRRSLADGDKGAATQLVVMLGKRFDATTEPDIVAGLRRDAWACDGMAMAGLRGIAVRHPQLLAPNDIGALREIDRAKLKPEVDAMRRAAEPDARRKAWLDSKMESLKPVPDADPAEVARRVADLRTRCPDDPAP